MKRILHIYPCLNNAGTENVILNVLKAINRKKVCFDFCVQAKGSLDSEFKKLDSKIYYLSNTSNYINDLNLFFSEHPEYQIIHVHTQKLMGKILKCAKNNNIKYRIAHSHTARSDLPNTYRILKFIKDYNIEINANRFVACSKESAKWLFPIHWRRAQIWPNCINVHKYLFDSRKRFDVRQRYNIPNNALVLCHIGRFSKEKNHKKIISISNHFCSLGKDKYVFLVGSGYLFDDILKLSKSERIIFTGSSNHVEDILFASDAFVFPSFHEGFPLAPIEAQVSGLYCYVSDCITNSIDINTGLLNKINIKSSDNLWVNRIINDIKNNNIETRIAASKKSINSRININNRIKSVEEYYDNLI